MRALFISPHLDDVAFSCGGTLAAWADAGRCCVLLTCFTQSVVRPAGFALACQTDKGIAPDVDYMALRRAEDRRAAAILGAEEVVHLELPEAPHRGYHSAKALFRGPHREDAIWRDLRELLAVHVAQADVVVVPQGLGDHVDHVQTRLALSGLGGDRLAYRDTPYALRAAPAPRPGERAERIPLDRKLDACAAYGSQLGFQFGGEAAMRDTLAAFAAAEGARLGAGAGAPAEALAPDA